MAEFSLNAEKKPRRQITPNQINLSVFIFANVNNALCMPHTMISDR